MTGAFPPACLQIELCRKRSGAFREVREADAEAEWSADSDLESGNPGGGSLRFCQRRQSEQQKAQSHAAIKWGGGVALF